MEIKQVITIFVIFALMGLVCGCTTTRYYEVTIVEKYPVDGIWGDRLVKIDDGSIIPVDDLIFDRLQEGHRYLVKIGGVSVGMGFDAAAGIVGIEKEI